MTKASPTSRSLAYCRRQGWHAAVVEKWNPHAMIRQDLFGCFDLIVVMPELWVWFKHGYPPQAEMDRLADQYRARIIGVQACAGASHAARREKVAAAAVLPDWLAAGAVAEVWSWSKQGPRGKRKVWTLRRERVLPNDITGASVTDLRRAPDAALAGVDLADHQEPAL